MDRIVDRKEVFGVAIQTDRPKNNKHIGKNERGIGKAI